jgi:hypothetical protein
VKLINSCFFLLLLNYSYSQPTGYQKLFIEIKDDNYVIDFKKSFKKSKIERFDKINNKNYQLIDLSYSGSGFSFYPKSNYIHKTLMTKNHHLLIIKNGIDTMSIELLNCFGVYFLSIPFQKGNYKMYINDDPEWKVDFTLIPKKEISTEQLVYNITPSYLWKRLEVSKGKDQFDYNLFPILGFTSNSRAQIPEDNPGFKGDFSNKIDTIKNDYNFDGLSDYRLKSKIDSSKWDYYIYDNQTGTFIKNTLLSSLDNKVFNFKDKTFVGYKKIKIDRLTVQTDFYQFINGYFVLSQRTICHQKQENSERIDCDYYNIVDGKEIYLKSIKGAE